jgi:hypothetical protein
MSAEKFWSKGEVRLNDDGSIDEVVTGQLRGVHLEQMAAGSWWMSLDGPHGRRMCICFHSKAKIRVTAEDDGFHSSGITIGFKQ